MESPNPLPQPNPSEPSDSFGRTAEETSSFGDFPSVPPPVSSITPLPTALAGESPLISPTHNAQNDRLEPFVRRNLAPFGVVCAAFFMFVSFGVLLELDGQLREEYAKSEESSGEEKTVERKEVKLPRAERTATSSAETALFGALVLSGFLFCGFLVIGGFFSENIRRIFDFRRRQLGPPPALNEADFLAVVSLYVALVLWGSVAVSMSARIFQWDEVAKNTFGAAAGMAAYGLLIPIVIWLARRRAAAEGLPMQTSAAGFWPFWRRIPPFPDDGARGLGKDFALGIFTWPLFFWIFAVATIVNENALVYWAGGEEILDRNVVFDVLQQTTWKPLLLLIIFFTVVCAPFFEELFFRGFLYNALRRRLGFGAAAVLSAALFSVIHQVNANLLPLFVLGLLFAWLYERTGRLVAPMAFHAVFNGISLLLFLLGSN